MDWIEASLYDRHGFLTYFRLRILSEADFLKSLLMSTQAEMAFSGYEHNYGHENR